MRLESALTNAKLLAMTIDGVTDVEIAQHLFEPIVTSGRLPPKELRQARNVLAAKSQHFFGVRWRIE